MDFLNHFQRFLPILLFDTYHVLPSLTSLNQKIVCEKSQQDAFEATVKIVWYITLVHVSLRC